MALPVNYYHAEILANQISQTRYVLKNLKKKGYISPHATALEYQTIHFGGIRGSGHSKAIEELTFVYNSIIIRDQRYGKHQYKGAAPGTPVTWIQEAMRRGMKSQKAHEVVFIDNWTLSILPEYPDLNQMMQQLSYAYDAYKNNTIFVLVH